MSYISYKYNYNSYISYKDIILRKWLYLVQYKYTGVIVNIVAS